MIGPNQLTHIIYVVLVVIFVGFVAAVVIYNLRVKARQRELARPGEESHDTQSSIAAATESLKNDARKR